MTFQDLNAPSIMQDNALFTYLLYIIHIDV